MSSCPDCERQMNEYGFIIEDDNYYMTKVPEIKQCCPVKVFVTRHTSRQVDFIHDDKSFSMDKETFLKSSWRVYESF